MRLRALPVLLLASTWIGCGGPEVVLAPPPITDAPEETSEGVSSGGPITVMSSNVAPGIAPEVSPGVTPEVSPGVTPEVSPGVTPENAGCPGPKPAPDAVCLQDCGPPVARVGDPPPQWRWRTAEEADKRRRFGCPICLPEDARIATPTGDVLVSAMHPGMPVYTLDSRGNRVQGTVERVGSTNTPPSHQLVQIELSDGRKLRVSPGHPTSEGRALGTLRVGEKLDGATVLRSTLVPYGQARTYDILPAGETGAYWANGVLIGSTLRPKP